MSTRTQTIPCNAANAPAAACAPAVNPSIPLCGKCIQTAGVKSRF